MVLTVPLVRQTTTSTRLRCRLAAAFAALLLVAAHAQALTLDYLGQQIVPTGMPFAGTTVGGLSALDYDAAQQRYFALSDDRSAIGAARFYTLALDLAQFRRSADPGMAGVTFTGVTTLQKSGGGAYAPNTLDPEGMRLDAARGRLYWSSEGQRSSAGLQNPAVRSIQLSGEHVGDFAVPALFNPSGSVGGLQPGDRGVYDNLAFEGLAISPNGRTLWTASENALAQDGPPASVAHGSPVRFLSFDLDSGAAGAQYVYPVGPVAVPPNPISPFAINGLSDFVAIGERRWITVERSFALGAQTPGQPVTGYTIRLYLADASAATDVSALDSIAGQSVTAMTKTLLLDLSTLHHDDGSALALDNIEGIGFGPAYLGRPTLVLVSDNNFNGNQFTQFVALSVSMPVPEPGSWALLAAGLGAVASRVRQARGRAARAAGSSGA